MVFHFKGIMDVGALERSLIEIVRRHEVLQATFPAVEDRPVQVILEDDAALELSKVDVPDGSAADRIEWVMRACEAESRRPFDLGRGPLLRLMLFRFSTNEHVLLIVFHHIIFDGFSCGILLGEMAALYEAFSEGQ